MRLVKDAASPLQHAAGSAEVTLAVSLLGDLPAFPDADIADVLDVRSRLADPLARLRATLAAAAHDLADVPAVEFAAAADAFRREHVDPSLVAVREELADLRWTRVSRGMSKLLLFMVVVVVAGVGRPSRRQRRLSL